MMNKIPTRALLFWMLAALSAASSCTVTNTTWDTSTDCINPSWPYCLGGVCRNCLALQPGDYRCDCPSGQLCLKNPNDPNHFSLCGLGPKYGSACSSDQDCVTSYQDFPEYTIYLTCSSGTCRYCNPSTQSTPWTCPYGVKLGKAIYCAPPGVWANYVNSSSSTSTTTTTTLATSGATTTSLGINSTTTSG